VEYHHGSNSARSDYNKLDFNFLNQSYLNPSFLIVLVLKFVFDDAFSKVSLMKIHLSRNNECHKDPKGTELCSDLAIKIYTFLVKSHFFVLLVFIHYVL